MLINFEDQEIVKENIDSITKIIKVERQSLFDDEGVETKRAYCYFEVIMSGGNKFTYGGEIYVVDTEEVGKMDDLTTRRNSFIALYSG